MRMYEKDDEGRDVPTRANRVLRSLVVVAVCISIVVLVCLSAADDGAKTVAAILAAVAGLAGVYQTTHDDY